MKKIMFICTGNICRSAMAHRLLEKRLKEEEKDVLVYSCGIFAQNGDRSTKNAIEVMKKYGVQLEKHRATSIESSNIKDMDLILCATMSHKVNVITMYPELDGKVYTIKEYLNKQGTDILDPYGGDIEVYKKCAEEINSYIEELLEKI